jgi:hypothetical protein
VNTADPATGTRHPAPRPSREAPARRRRRWPLALGTLLLLALGALALVWNLVDAVDVVPVSLTIDGERVVDDIDLAGLSPAHRTVLVLLLAFAVLTAVLAVPVALLMALIALALALLLPVGIGLAALAVATSPLWLLGWLLWRTVAGRPSPPPATSDTMKP